MNSRIPDRHARFGSLVLFLLLSAWVNPLGAQSAPVTGGCAGGALGPAHDQPGVVCEDFDTDRNGSGSIEWNRLVPVAPICDPYRSPEDLADDILGGSLNGGPAPFGVAGQICSLDTIWPEALSTCHVVPTENDWHIHSAFEGCDVDDSYDLGDTDFATSCAPDTRAHSGFRSLHLGRHLRGTDTLWDTYRMRQTSAFVMDPVHLGTSSTLEFWQVIQVCDEICLSRSGGTFAGGQVQISLMNDALGVFEPWRPLTFDENDYDTHGQAIYVICEFDPGDDFLPPGNETMCLDDSPQWSNIGDFYGSDRTCMTDTDGNDPTWRDCGRTDNQTVDPNCTWIADPNCGSFLENGSTGDGVWARSMADLSPFADRHARLRWIFQGGGGWSFGESRSFLEPEPGNSPYMAADLDAGWYVDDIRITDVLETEHVCVDGDGDGYGPGGDPTCPAGPAADCDCSNAASFPGAVEICDRLDNDCDAFIPADEMDGDGDDVTLCEGDCNDTDPANITTPPATTGLLATPSGNGILMTWDDLGEVAGSDTRYDIFTGLVSDLRSGAGFGAGSCEKNNASAATHTAHGPDPPLGDMRYYIVRGQNGCPAGDGSWGSPTRDAEVAASSFACN